MVLKSIIWYSCWKSVCARIHRLMVYLSCSGTYVWSNPITSLRVGWPILWHFHFCCITSIALHVVNTKWWGSQVWLVSMKLIYQPEFQTIFPCTYFMTNFMMSHLKDSISFHTAHIIPRGWYLCYSEWQSTL